MGQSSDIALFSFFYDRFGPRGKGEQEERLLAENRADIRRKINAGEGRGKFNDDKSGIHCVWFIAEPIFLPGHRHLR
jgi:hypothetical protein